MPEGSLKALTRAFISVEASARRPHVAVKAVDSRLHDLLGANQLVIDISLPAHSLGIVSKAAQEGE